jgi:hypothetical protein
MGIKNISFLFHLMDSILIRKMARLMDTLKRIAARFVLVLDNFISKRLKF